MTRIQKVSLPDAAAVSVAYEVAKLVMPEYREAIHKVRETIASIAALRDEEWSSLTKHVTELYVLQRFGYLRCCSADSVLDGIIPMPDETEVRFDARDQAFLRERGIQIKGRRSSGKRYSFTGDVKLSSAFKYLYVVWIDITYRVIESEVYRLDFDVVKAFIDDKQAKNPDGKNNRKITRKEAQKWGIRLPVPNDG